MADVSGEPEVDDRLRDKSIVDFLRAVDVAPSGDASRVDVPDPLHVFTNIRHQIAYCRPGSPGVDSPSNHV
ncbi:MAG: hypothetical protein EXQ53_09230 [Acidobacteria bacterium]|nr:hypothetical protein [Acidobacteriota bacterium]